jgi:hypothetical protein
MRLRAATVGLAAPAAGITRLYREIAARHAELEHAQEEIERVRTDP